MSHLQGPLHFEVMGEAGAPPMVFLHPNPLDSSSWIYQMAHFSTWFRCVAIDLPGYGRSPRATDGLTMTEIATACWEAVSAAAPAAPAVLVGCSVGQNVAQHMYRLQPDRVQAVVLSGAGLRPEKDFVPLRVSQYEAQGVEFRREHALAGMSASFAESPMAAWFIRMCMERNHLADAPTIVRMFRALGEPDPPDLQRGLRAPVLILNGSEDSEQRFAPALRDALPDARLVTIPGAGHACYLEQPWAFDNEVIRFLRNVGVEGLPEVEDGA